MQSIKKSYIYNLCYQILTIVIPIITTPYVSRVLGSYNIGIYSYIMSIETYFLLFAALGTAFYGKREVARCRDDYKRVSQVFWEIEILSIISVLLWLFIWGLFILSRKRFTIYYWMLSINIVAVAVDITWLFSGFEKFDYIIRCNILVKLISVILIFIFVRKSDDLYIYIFLNSVSVLIGNGLMWMRLRDIIEPFGKRKISVKEHFRKTMVYFLPTIATTIYTVMDKTMIQIFTRNLYENGYYEQATKICRIPMALLLSMDSVMGSRMSYLFGKNDNIEIKRKLEISIQFVAFLATPLVIGINTIIRQLVPWFLGEGYNGVISLVYLYSPLIVCIGINNCLSEQYLIPIGKRERTTVVVIVGAVINFILNSILIPRYFASGAAVASVISEAYIAICYIVMCRKVIPIRTYINSFWKNIFSAIVMMCVVTILTHTWKANIFCTIIQIILGGIIYFSILFVSNDSFFREKIIIIFSKMSKKRGK